MDRESPSDGGGHLEHDGINHDQEEPEGDNRQGESYDFQDQPQRRVYQSEDYGCDQCGDEAVQLKAGNNVSDDQQRHSINKPTDQEPHIVPSSLARMPYCIIAKKKAAPKRGLRNLCCMFFDLSADLPEAFEDAEEEDPMDHNRDNMQARIGGKQKHRQIAGIKQQADEVCSFHAACSKES